jgi:hypothetical protein
VANKQRGLDKDTGSDILSLREATHNAGTTYVMLVAPRVAAPFDRAGFVLNEITATLEWLFDDGVEDERDAQLAAVKKEHEDSPDSHDAWAAELEDYAALATTYKNEMAGLGGFNLALIDEARLLAAQFRGRPALPAIPSEEVARAKALRSRLATLLWTKISTVRGAARFVFRNHPDIVREVTRAYERRRRAASRRKKAGGPPADGGGEP